jgi:outer membrane protein assembly factor BamB
MLRLTLPGVLALALLVGSQPLGAADSPAGDNWFQWRGPHRDGVSRDTGLLKEWPKDGPPLVWEAKGAGRGYASLAISNGRLYTMGDGPSTATDKDEYLLCFDAATGKQLWKGKLGPAWNSGTSDWQSSRSTPTVDGDRVYILTPRGELVCLETAGGKEVWRKSMQKDFNGKKADYWGYSESVLIDGDKLVCTPGGEATTLVALDKKTGSPIWKATQPSNRGAGHSSIVIAEIGNTRVYVQMTGSGALGVAAEDGKVLWHSDIPSTTAVIPTPIVRGDLVFFSVGYGRGAALLRQVPEGKAGVSIEQVYPLDSKLNNKHGGVVLVGDYVYGDVGDSGRPFCAELMTGKIRWQKKAGPGRGSASVVAADGHLYIRYADGTMTLVKATPDEFNLVSSFKIPHSGSRPSWSHPVVTGGKLYLREDDYILCYDLRAK